MLAAVSEAFDLGPVPQRVPVDAQLVATLVARQFPQWRDLPVQPVADDGWDNHTFRLGDALSVRTPSAAAYALAVEKEHRWLPRLAPQLPLPVPVPVAGGRPDTGYPFPWSVYRWLAGEPLATAPVADPGRLAEDFAEFLLALRAVDPEGGPGPGLHDWFRGGPLRTFDGLATEALHALRGRVDLDLDLARAVWTDALETPWDGVRTWFHGDLAPGNLLVRDGRLGAVIDFGTCGVGDPACDVAAAWTLLDPAGRQVFRDRLQLDDDTWTRGRGWALWKTLTTVASSTGRTDGTAARSLAVLHGLLEDARSPR